MEKHEMAITGDVFLIEKRSAYYRPDDAGYTFFKSDAGRYSFDEAVLRVGPNGPDGPQDGLVMWREADAPDCLTGCPALEARNHKLGLRVIELKAALSERLLDQIDIYRLIKKSGARKHGDIASVIADALKQGAE